MTSSRRRAMASHRRPLGQIVLMAMAGGAVVGIAWAVYVLFGFIDWYPVIYHPGPGPTPSPLIAIPFLGAVAGGGALALSPLRASTRRVFAAGFTSHAILALLVYGAMPIAWFETQTPFHVVFFGLGALATILVSVAASPLRLTAAALVVAGVASAIDAIWVAGKNLDPDLYAALVVGIAIAYWLVLVLAATADRVLITD